MDARIALEATSHNSLRKGPVRVNIRAVGEPVLVGTGSVDLEVFVPPPEPLALPPGLQHGWKGHPIRRRHTENNANVELQYYPRFGSGSGTISPPPGFASRSSQMMNNGSRLTESTMVALSTDSQSSVPASGPQRVRACDAGAGWQELDDLDCSPLSPDSDTSQFGTRASQWVEDDGWPVETTSSLQSYREEGYRTQKRMIIQQHEARLYQGDHQQCVPYQEPQRSREHVPPGEQQSYDHVQYIHHEHSQQADRTSHMLHVVPTDYTDPQRHDSQQGDGSDHQAQCSWHKHPPSATPAYIQDSSRRAPESHFHPQHEESTYTDSSYSHARDWLHPTYGATLNSLPSGEESQSSDWRTASQHQVDLAQIARYSPQPQTPLPSWEDIVRTPEYPETHRNRSNSHMPSQHHNHTGLTDRSTGQRSRKHGSGGHSDHLQHSSHRSHQGAYNVRQGDSRGLDSAPRDPPASARPSSSCGHGPYDGPVGLPSPGAEIWAPRVHGWGHGHSSRISNAPRARDPMRIHEEIPLEHAPVGSRWNVYSTIRSSGEAPAPWAYKEGQRRVSRSWGGEQSIDSWTEDQSMDTVRGDRTVGGIRGNHVPSGVERYLATMDRVEALQQESPRRRLPGPQHPELHNESSGGVRFRGAGDHYDLGVWGNPDRAMESRNGVRRWMDTVESDAPSMWDVADGEGVAQEVEAALQAGVITRGVGASDGTRWSSTNAMMRNSEAPDDSWGSVPNSFELPPHEVYELPGRAIVPGVVTAFNGLPRQRGSGDRTLAVASQHYPHQYPEIHHHGSYNSSQGIGSYGPQRKGLVHGPPGMYSSQTPFLGESDAAKLQRARATQVSRATLRPRDGRSEHHLTGGITTDRPTKYSGGHNNGGFQPVEVVDENSRGSSFIVDERILQHRAEKEKRLTKAMVKPEGNPGFFHKTLGGILKDCVVPRAARLCPVPFQDRVKSSNHSRSQQSVNYTSGSPGGNPGSSGGGFRGHRPRAGVCFKNPSWIQEEENNL